MSPSFGSRSIPTDPSDSVLVNAVRSGRTAAFRSVYRRHFPAAYAYASACVTAPMDAALITEVAFSSLLKELQANKTAFWNHYSGCLRRRILESVRTIAATQSEPRRYPLTPAFHDWVAGGSVWPMAEDGQLTAAFIRLTPEDQCLLWHSLVEHEPAEVVSSITGLPPRDISPALSTARDRLWHLRMTLYLERIDRPGCAKFLLELRPGRPLSSRAEEHLRLCTACRAVHEQLVNLDWHLERQMPTSLLAWWPNGYQQAKEVVPYPRTDPPFLACALRKHGREESPASRRTAPESHRGPRDPRRTIRTTVRPATILLVFTLGAIVGRAGLLPLSALPTPSSQVAPGTPTPASQVPAAP